MNEKKSFDDIKNLCSKYMNEEELKIIQKYYEQSIIIYKDMKRKTGEDYIHHPLNVAYILACLKMDPISIGCSLIHEAIIQNKMSEEQIENMFGSESLSIIKSLTKLSNIKRTFNKETNIEHDRRVIVGLAENPKALFIRLADRTDNMRTLYVFDKEHQKEIIEETENILIPIAHRLGVKQIKSKLEDYCFKYSKPEFYDEIKEMINADEKELNDSLKQMKLELSDLLREHEIDFEITSRVKSIYGIGQKLEKGRRFSDIYDLLGLRILVNNTEECYLIIGLIHSKYKGIAKRFKDFIAKPKENMYRSIHTTVFGPGGHMYEIQIRTYEMDEIAEKGVASHWSYKEHTDGNMKSTLENKLEKFRSLVESQDNEDNEDFFKNFESGLNKEEIYIFTPKGDIIELPIGATPVDFAYRIHSEIGNTLVSAIVNDNIVKLDYKLNDEDIVSLNTKEGSEPNKDWLNFVATETAKSRIKSYYSKQEKEKYINLGKDLLSNYLKKQKKPIKDILNDENIERVIKELKQDNLNDLYLSIGALKFTPQYIYNKLINKKEEELSDDDLIKKVLKNKTNTDNKTDFIISGETGILASSATCCNPVYGEDVVGFITKGYGVKVHKKDCINIKESNRLIDVVWNIEGDNKYSTKLNIYVDSKTEKMIDIMAVSTKLNVQITSIKLIKKDKTYYEIVCEVKDIDTLNKYISLLNSIKFVTNVERI